MLRLKVNEKISNHQFNFPTAIEECDNISCDDCLYERIISIENNDFFNCTHRNLLKQVENICP